MSAGANESGPPVLVFPPLLLAAMPLAAALLGALVPLSLVPPMGAAAGLWPGLALILAGIAIAGLGVKAFKAAGTNVNPQKPSLTIVTDGPYRFTRNPMYLGMLLLALGLGLLLSLDWAPLLVPVHWAILHWGVVLREEGYLTETFGAPYTAYLATTRRWV